MPTLEEFMRTHRYPLSDVDVIAGPALEPLEDSQLHVGPLVLGRVWRLGGRLKIHAISWLKVS
jgi:hypothetical protein